jgi:hypothetical protein
MKTLGVVSVLFGAAVVLGVAGSASAGFYPWASPCGVCDGPNAGEYPTGGYNLGACGGGGCGWRCYGRMDYDRYIIGHGPMFPAGDHSIGFSYGATITPKTPPAPNTAPGPNGH